MTINIVPWGDDPAFDWNDDNQREIAAHGVKDFEVEQCFENEEGYSKEFWVSRHKKARSDPESYGDRYIVKGSTLGGRRLTIIIQCLGGSWIRPITAWDIE